MACHCCSRLWQILRSKTILSGVSLSVERGSVMALIGANGCGKSTFLKSLIRLVEPSQGRIELFDRDVMAMNRADLRKTRSRVGMVWQKHNLVPRLTAMTNVLHGAQSRLAGPGTWFQSLAPERLRREALECLDRVGLADLAGQRVDSLSGGQSQRVAIARVLMQNPDIILADEPDASLDPKSGDEVMALLAGLSRQSGLTLVFVSHRLEHAISHSDRIIGFSGGTMALDCRTDSVDAKVLHGFFDDRMSA